MVNSSGMFVPDLDRYFIDRNKNVPGANRTHDLQLRRLLLYPTELQGQNTLIFYWNIFVPSPKALQAEGQGQNTLMFYWNIFVPGPKALQAEGQGQDTLISYQNKTNITSVGGIL